MTGDFSELQERQRNPAAKSEELHFASLIDEGLFGKQPVAAKPALRLADGGGSPGSYEDDPDNPRRPDRDDDDPDMPRRPHESDDDPPFLMPEKKFDGSGSPGTYEPDDEPRRPGGGDDDDPDMPRRPSEDEEPPFLRPKK